MIRDDDRNAYSIVYNKMETSHTKWLGNIWSQLLTDENEQCKINYTRINCSSFMNLFEGSTMQSSHTQTSVSQVNNDYFMIQSFIINFVIGNWFVVGLSPFTELVYRLNDSSHKILFCSFINNSWLSFRPANIRNFNIKSFTETHNA